MMKNKKGFTLVELLAVVAIVALISLIAIPNIVGLTDGIRKDQMLDDAKKLISMAKYQVNKSYSIRNSSTYTFTFSELNTSGDISQDPDSTDGSNYINGSVTYTNNGTARYCVYLEGIKRTIGSSSNCVYEENLYSKSNVVDK